MYENSFHIKVSIYCGLLHSIQYYIILSSLRIIFHQIFLFETKFNIVR